MSQKTIEIFMFMRNINLCLKHLNRSIATSARVKYFLFLPSDGIGGIYYIKEYNVTIKKIGTERRYLKILL